MQLPLDQSPHPRRLTRLAAVAVLFAGLLTAGSERGLAAGLTCGPQPDIGPAASAQQVKDDTKARTRLILDAKPDPRLRIFVSLQRSELRQKHPELEAPAIDGYLLWLTCRTLSDDATLSGSQKFDKYADLYRLLSEPGREPAKAE